MSERLGNFELVEELGSGAWGRVYKARQANVGGRHVAVKVLWPQLAADPTARQRFLDEARSTAQLSHAHIVKIIDAGEQAGMYYIAMDFVEGQPLADLMAQRGPLPPAQAAEFGAQIAEALGHAHARGVVHRDIKPGNVMIDAEGRVAITDFGIAKVGEGSGLTKTGAAIGTPEYMSPEQAQGNPVDGRSDLYSLGVVLYHMVTGQVPFSGPTPISVGMKHVSEAARDPRQMRPDCPEWLAGLIMRAVAKQPYDRFATGEEMAAALRAGLVTQPSQSPAPQATPAVAAPPPNKGRIAAPAVPRGRRRAAAPVLVAALILVAALMAVGVWVRSTPGGGLPDPIRRIRAVWGGGAGSSSPEAARVRAEAIAAIERLHQAITDHNPGDALACFTQAPDGTPPYGLDEIESYEGTEWSRASDFRELAYSGDRASIECTVTVQATAEYFETDFAYVLKREAGRWLIESASLLGETATTSGRHPGGDT